MTNDEMTKRMPGESNVMDIPALGMWFFLAGEAMFFVGLLGSFVVLESAGGQHEVFAGSSGMLNLRMGIGSAILLLISSAVIWRNKSIGNWIAMVLLIGFLAGQGRQWEILLANQNGPWRNNFFACYFLFTAVHGLHVMVGMMATPWFLIRPTPVSEVHRRAGLSGEVSGSSEYLRDRRRGGSKIPAPLQMYWHFVNAIGVLGFFVLYFVR